MQARELFSASVRFPRSLVLLLVVLCLAGGLPASAAASHGQETMLQDDAALLRDPVATLQTARDLGVNRMRVGMRWLFIAPRPNSRQRPRGFKSADPGAYPDRVWRVWDSIVTTAQQDGISLNLDLEGGSPRWATGPGAPPGSALSNWEPSPGEFQAFVRAVGTRYSGNYDPTTKSLQPGSPNDLPAVRFWSIWNEPNYGPSLAPQGVPGNLQLEHSPRMYRDLVDAAWSGLRSTGHGHDTVLIGELAPRGTDRWGVFSGMKPLVFLRGLYCVDSRYGQLRGSAAATLGCPTTRAGSRGFRSAHPGLFQATALSDHPYMRWYSPNHEVQPDPNYSSLGEIGGLERSLDRLQRAYGSNRRLPIYNTEFGYITSPPKHPSRKTPWVSASTAASYLNWAEYISWRDARIQSFMQYLVFDPLPARKSNDFGGFASGLFSYGGKPKATRDAFRLPVYLPVTSARRGQSLEVWGNVRPATYARVDARPGAVQTAQIQLEPSGSSGFTTVKTVTIADPHGYVDTQVPFASSGTVRLAWTYPAGDRLLGDGATVYSRSVQISLH